MLPAMMSDMRVISVSAALCAWRRTVTTTAARLVPAWATSTPYLFGEVVTNGGKLFRCIDDGTSAGSGTGPEATSTNSANITDNTTAWALVQGFSNGFMVTNLDPTNPIYIGSGANITSTKASGVLLAGQTKAYPLPDPSEVYVLSGGSVGISIEAAL